jgi:hypothetical protein
VGVTVAVEVGVPVGVKVGVKVEVQGVPLAFKQSVQVGVNVLVKVRAGAGAGDEGLFLFGQPARKSAVAVRSPASAVIRTIFGNFMGASFGCISSDKKRIGAVPIKTL